MHNFLENWLWKHKWWTLVMILGYCDEIRVQKDCLIFCRIVNNLANIEYKVNKAVVGMHICDFCH